MAQMAVLQSMISNPEKPMSLGPHEGKDLIDLLLGLIAKSSGSLKQAQTVCLMSFQDPRVTRFLVEEFARCTDPALVLRLAGRIVLERDIEFFRPFLWQTRPAQALAAARLCSRLELEPAERLRVALLLDSEFEPPEINVQTLDLWLAELLGPHRLRTKQLAEIRPEGALLLWQRWQKLTEREQEWLVTLTAKCRPALLAQKLPDLLGDPAVPAFIASHALEHEISLPPSLLNHRDPKVRATAISCGHADAMLCAYLAPEASTEEAVAALTRCGPSTWVEHLSDERWQVRAAATNLLCQSDSPPLEEVRRLSESPDLATKVAALRVLERHSSSGAQAGGG